MPQLMPISRLLVSGLTTGFWTLVSLPGICWRIIRVGPNNYFYSKDRTNSRPQCLDDPSLGSHQYIKLKSVTLHCVIAGSPDKPLMLFLHGFPELWYSWHNQIREFSKDYRTVAVDMRGYGESTKPSGISNYTIDLLCEDVNQLIEALGYKSCVLVAHDWGGFVAQYFTSVHPNMVDRLMLCNIPHPTAFAKYMASSLKQMAMSWYMYFFQLPYLPEMMVRAEDYAWVVRALLAKHAVAKNKSAFSQEDQEAYKYSLGRPHGLTAPINYYRAMVRYRPNHRMAKINVPTLMVWGVHDIALSKDMAVTSGNYYPNYTLHFIPNAGHWVQQEDPEEVNKHMRDFLSSEPKGNKYLSNL